MRLLLGLIILCCLACLVLLIWVGSREPGKGEENRRVAMGEDESKGAEGKTPGVAIRGEPGRVTEGEPGDARTGEGEGPSRTMPGDARTREGEGPSRTAPGGASEREPGREEGSGLVEIVKGNPYQDAKIGEWVKIRMPSSGQVVVLKQEVVEKDRDSITIRSTMSLGGIQFKATENTIRFTTDKKKLAMEGRKLLEGLGSQIKTGIPDPTEKQPGYGEGRETLVIGGKKVNTWYREWWTRGGMIKEWWSRGVPIQRMVKSTTEGTVTWEVVDFMKR